MTASVRFGWLQATQNARRRHPKPSIHECKKYKETNDFSYSGPDKKNWCRIKNLINAWLPMLPLLPPALSPQIFNESLLIFNVFRWFSIIISYSKWVLKESQSFPMLFNNFQWFSAIFNYFQCKSMSAIDLQWSSMIFNDFQRLSIVFKDFHWYSLISNGEKMQTLSMVS